MKTHNIDSIFKNAIDESEGFYSSEANDSKERIWDNIRTQKQKHPRLILFWSLVAACILLFFSTTVISLWNIKAQNKIETLVELNSNLMKKNMEKSQNFITATEPEKVAIANSIDTVYIEKEVIISKPIVITEVISDTVFIEQIVYVEKETSTELVANNDITNQTESSSQFISESIETKILIRNSKNDKKGKKKKVQIKFGSNKNQSNSGTLAYTKEF